MTSIDNRYPSLPHLVGNGARQHATGDRLRQASPETHDTQTKSFAVKTFAHSNYSSWPSVSADLLTHEACANVK